MADRCRLRRASSADVSALAALGRAAFSDPWTPRQLAIAIGDEAVSAWVAEESDAVRRTIVGYALGRTVADEGEILSIASAPSRRRRGIGRVLLDTALADMVTRGAASAWLEVRRSNAAARAMYVRAGFVEAGTRRSYYAHPTEDALIFRRDLALLRPPQQ